ncbi:serine carboxypeptidase-like 45 isoform X1 [Ziziphus jujuba]|uniref:Carboxypeptidase n=1 Tax=Ziziphus jujuba TaxID=326968 RepID=A0A6P4BFZ4_ZIZJJ|nr:serine carboxypeptidase-like 45 isoform X1 [Ziziphus jujuba]
MLLSTLNNVIAHKDPHCLRNTIYIYMYVAATSQVHILLSLPYLNLTMAISQPRIVLAILCLTSVLTFLSVESHSKYDLVESLPGQPPVSFKQFSGYITVDQKQHRALFYYFVQAQTEPASKPLVLWLNGGPGCSSLGAGAFSEHGPFRPNTDATLVKNEYSWNKEANILYLESPAGVGFSYSANASFYNYVNDTITAQDNLIFLQRWFDKFPQYKNRDFFITGESYAGHYVPQLAHLILQSNVKFNLKGIAIGNPLLDFNNDFNAEDEFNWSHGVISDFAYELITSYCNTSRLTRESIRGNLSDACSIVYEQISGEFSDFIDGYDVIADVCIASNSSRFDIAKHPIMSRFRISSSRLSNAKSLTQQQTSDSDSNSENKIDVCVGEKTTKYLNRKVVQSALHAQLVGVPQWTSCSGVLHYDYENLEIPTIPIVGALVESGIRVLVYSGDQDSVIPFIGSRSLVNKLAKELGLKTTVPYRVWFEGKQVGGWTQVYGSSLSFASIRGASHLAPATQPERSLVLFKSFLEGKPLPEA